MRTDIKIFQTKGTMKFSMSHLNFKRREKKKKKRKHIWQRYVHHIPTRAASRGIGCCGKLNDTVEKNLTTT
jgi:hypothetical protein